MCEREEKKEKERKQKALNVCDFSSWMTGPLKELIGHTGSNMQRCYYLFSNDGINNILLLSCENPLLQFC